MLDLTKLCRVCGADARRIGDERFPLCQRCRYDPEQRRKRWYKRESKRAHLATVRARSCGVEGTYAPADVSRLQRLQRGRCALCGGVLYGRFHVDHVVPLSKGGANVAKNLQLLCPPCNLRKGAAMPV